MCGVIADRLNNTAGAKRMCDDYISCWEIVSSRHVTLLNEIVINDTKFWSRDNYSGSASFYPLSYSSLFQRALRHVSAAVSSSLAKTKVVGNPSVDHWTDVN